MLFILLLFKFCVVHMCRFSHPCVPWRPALTLMMSFFLRHSPLLLETESLISWSWVPQFSELAGPQGLHPRYPPVSAPFTLSSGVTGASTRLGYYMGIMDSNPGPHTSRASTLPTEQSSQPPFFFLTVLHVFKIPIIIILKIPYATK